MSLQTITHDMAASLGLERDTGVIVSDVWPGGPAEAAGVRIGDVLLSVDGQAAENLPTVNYFFRSAIPTSRGPGRPRRQDAEAVQGDAGRTERLRLGGADVRSGAQSRRAARHHRRRDRPAPGCRREGAARSVRHRRRGPRRGRRGRNPAAAARHHPQLQQRADDVALVGLRRMLSELKAGSRARHAADPARKGG